jgi:type IV pilus assembly protein PilC
MQLNFQSFIQKLNILLTNLTPISLEEKIYFTKNLRVMIKAGLSLSVALKTLALQTRNKRFKKIILDLHEAVEKGQPLSDNMARFPKVFSEVSVNMVRAGEKSGKLEEVLEQITIQMKKIHELVGKVKGAMIYPAIVVLAMISIGTMMMIFVIPKILTIFEEIQATLPLATRLLIKLNNFIQAHGLLSLGGLIFFVGLFLKIISTKRGKFYFDLLLLRMPIFSNVVKKVNLAKFSRTFSSLLATDIPIVETFKITSKVLGNIHYRNLVFEAADKIKRGESIAKTLAINPHLFPPVVTQMLAVGEETGTLDSILNDLTEFYETDVKETMDAFATIIEPVLIVLLGIAVAGLAVAIIMPMYSLTQQI